MSGTPGRDDSEGIVNSRAPNEAGASASLPAPAAGQILKNYRLLEPIGAGGFSLVWRAERIETKDVVALKLPRVVDFIDHLRREARIGSLFQDPQVVGITEVCLDFDPPFLVMPFVAGRDLALPDRAPPPAEIVSAFRRFREIASVVARLHDAEIVHGDLKPGNLRFDPSGNCRVLDLGLARHQVDARRRSTLRASIASVTGEKIAGTLEYMSPELMSGEKPTKAADVYALGVILHAMLCGRPPAFGVSPTELNPYLPPRTVDFLRETLHPDPSLRPPSAGALLPAIDAFIRAEERCLRRRNGHPRRLVFQERMKTLLRGIKVLGFALLVGMFLTLLAVFGMFSLPRVFSDATAALLLFAGFPLALIGFLLGVTTINAFIARVPEKTYKNRRGHPWWTFMMQ